MTQRLTAWSGAVMLVAACALVLGVCSGISAPAPAGGYANWPGYTGPGPNHFSPLTQINDKTVSGLGLAWSYDISTGGSSLTAPIAVNGVLYFAGGLSVIHAIDARTGKLLWKYDPQVGAVAGDEMRAAWGSRGMAYDKGLVFTGTVDGRLIAVNAKTGKLAWSVKTTEKGDGRYITGAPWVFNGKVLIGHGGADFASVRGYVTAYDQRTGKQVWRFYTVPGDPAKGPDGAASDSVMATAAKTWTGEWWKYGGGGTAWNAFAYDPKYNRIYIGTGNGAPWNRKIRSPGGGDNLFVCSIIAVDADTGKYVWHYQVNPGETWDYNAAMDISLDEVMIDGKPRSVLMQAPKNGFFYMIDRETGKLISAKNFVPVSWAKGIDPVTGRPDENPEARFPDGKAVIVYPSPVGGHNIEAMSYSPASGLAYIPIVDQGRPYTDPAAGVVGWKVQPGEVINNGIGVPPAGLKAKPTVTALVAWNPKTQSEAWRIPLETARGGGGTMATAGNLLFQGRATGSFNAVAADSGKELWRFDAKSAVMAQPISYAIAGKQYVTVIAGARFINSIGRNPEWNYSNQQWRVLTFALGGKRVLPANPPLPPVLDDSTMAIDPKLAAHGRAVFGQRCALCHGGNAISAGAAPDLLRSPMALSAQAFAAVVKGGALKSRGMPQFADVSDADREAIRHFVRQRARETLAGQKAAKGVDLQ